MGKKKRPKDFPKIKLKVGKKLKKTAQTDTTIRTKKVVLIEQLAYSGDVVSHRGLSLNDLCKQLGHYNVNIRRDAVTGIKQLLFSKVELISSHLHILIPAIARLICDDKADSSFRSQLRCLFELLCQTPSLAMSSHFPLFLAHVLLALTHHKLIVRVFAVSTLVFLMRTYPDLCSKRRDLFDSLIGVLSSQKKPTSKQLLFDALNSLLNVFAIEKKIRMGPLQTGTFSVHFKQVSSVDFTFKPPDFHFSVLGPNALHDEFPLKTYEGILKLSAAAFPILETMLVDEESAFDDCCSQIIESLLQTVFDIRELGYNEDFEKKFANTVRPFMLMVNKRQSAKSLKSAVAKLEAALTNRV